MVRNDYCHRFFKEFLPSFMAEYPGWTPHQLSKDRYYQCLSCSLPGTKYSVCFPGEPENRLRVEVYIRQRDHDQFVRLHGARHQIEGDLGEGLCWEGRVPRGSAARISLYFPGDVDIQDESGWCELRAWLIRALGEMRRVFEPKV